MSSAIQITMPDANAIELHYSSLMSSDNQEKLLRAIAFMVEQQTVRRIHRTKTGPDGYRWTPWDYKYAERVATAQTRAESKRNKGRKASGPHHTLLEDTGSLRDSITSLVHVSYATVEVGSNLRYAATHQYGDADRGIPARPFLGLDESNKQALDRLVVNFLKGLLL